MEVKHFWTTSSLTMGNSVISEDHTNAQTYTRSGKHLSNYTTTLKVPNRDPTDQPESGTDVFPPAALLRAVFILSSICQST